MNTAQQEIINLLVTEWTRLRLKNPAYSLRAFSRRMRIPASALSGLLKGKHPVTKKTGQRVLEAIATEPAQATRILSGLKSRQNSSFGAALAAKSKKPQVQVDADAFRLVADWYCSAVFSLAETKTFDDCPKVVSQRLGISVNQAKSALEILERLGLLIRDKRGRLAPSGNCYQAPRMPSVYFLKHHRENLELAVQALEERSDTDSFSGITMAIDPRKIPEAKRRIDKFRLELCDFLENDKAQEVYRLNIQLFALSD